MYLRSKSYSDSLEIRIVKLHLDLKLKAILPNFLVRHTYCRSARSFFCVYNVFVKCRNVETK